MFYGLHEALRVLADETLQKCWARHQATAQALWRGLEDMGLQLLVNKDHRCALQLVWLPH